MPEQLTDRESSTRVRPPDTPRADLPDQVMMPLLDRIVRESLDEDYQVVAARKARRPRGRPQRGAVTQPPARPGRPRRVAAAVMAVFGLLVALAALQTSRDAPEASANRASLIEEIQGRRAGNAELQAELERLRNSTNDLRADVAQASEDEQALTARISRLGARTGLAAVTGAGLRITVDDAEDGDVTQQVRDSDLAALVDGLWSAGAEAISVNGRRLTNLTAFDNVGPAIHIEGTPLVSPYTVLVVGDPDTLAADLLDSAFGQRWYALVASFDFVYAASPADDLTLPAARQPRLRAVRLMDDQPDRPAQDPEAGAP
jgi:uncharacterized protein YlxW (UPF0749 family)